MNEQKEWARRVLRCVMAPWRRHCVKRDGVVDTSERRMMPNGQLLAIVADALTQGHTAVIWVRGYSMRPFLEHERDRVKLAYPDHVEVGDAVLAQVTRRHYVLHRVIRKDGHLLTLQGDGNVRGVEQCRLDDVCGVVVEYIRPLRTIPASDAALRRRIRLWRALCPVRRWLLPFYQALLP